MGVGLEHPPGGNVGGVGKEIWGTWPWKGRSEGAWLCVPPMGGKLGGKHKVPSMELGEKREVEVREWCTPCIGEMQKERVEGAIPRLTIRGRAHPPGSCTADPA